MSEENIYIRVLNKYGFMINGPEEFLKDIARFPKPDETETFKQWKHRVIKDPSVKITVYVPYEPAPQTRISTLIKTSGGQHLKKTFRHYERLKGKKLVEAIGEARQEISDSYSTIPKKTLVELIDELDDELQPSVIEFFERYTKSTEDKIGIELLLQNLIHIYNESVTKLNNKKIAIERCVKTRTVPTEQDLL